LKERVAELTAQGLSSDVIAARLKVSISEVELIIAIRDKGQAG
jgi:DNA-binding CsgD family transcriptional regulator